MEAIMSAFSSLLGGEFDLISTLEGINITELLNSFTTVITTITQIFSAIM